MTSRRLPLNAEQNAWLSRYLEKYPNGGPGNPPNTKAHPDAMSSGRDAARRERGDTFPTGRKKPQPRQR
jgi:hypothetical protein